MIPVLKAYAVTEPWENTGGVVFAKSDIAARREGADRYNDSEIGGMRVRRMKEWDKYSVDGVPVSDMIHAGWHFECCGCGVRMDEDWYYDNAMTPSQAVGVDGGSAYCCWTCEAEDKADQYARAAYGRSFIRHLRDHVTERFGDVAFQTDTFKEHAHVRRQGNHFIVEQACVSFVFPGMEYGPAGLHYGHPQCRDLHAPMRLCYTVPNGDRKAFEEWANNTLQCV